MIAPGSVALLFQARRTPAGRLALRCRAVFVQAVIDLGPLGIFAEVRTGEHDSRVFAHRYEADTLAVDVRELLSLAWLESLAGSRLCVPPPPKRAA